MALAMPSPRSSVTSNVKTMRLIGLSSLAVVVSAIATPDEYIVCHRQLRILQSALGTKEHKIVRNAELGNGTLHLPVSDADRSRFTLNDDHVAQLAQIGLNIQTAYDGFPQDVDWGYHAGQFYVLQTCPVTAVDFSWDADVTESVQGNSDAVAYDNVRSRVFPEEMWTGVISPLMFSWRCWGLNQCHSVGVHAFGDPEQDYTTQRLWKYHKGVSYYNASMDLMRIKQSILPQLRAGMLHKIPLAWHEEANAASFDWERYLDKFRRVEFNRPRHGPELVEGDPRQLHRIED